MSSSLNPSNKNIMIVEDEVLISDMIRHHVTRHGYKVAGDAISYNEAVERYRAYHPDIILLDIQLSGTKTGIDFACFLRNQSSPPPFIFLTSQLDDHLIGLAKATAPAGYLSKPLQIASMLALVEATLFNAASFREPVKTVRLQDQGVNHVVPVRNIQYLEAEHVYVRFVLNTGQEIMQRGTMKEMLVKLDDKSFVQAHRSYVINKLQVTGYDKEFVYFGRCKIPISRSRRKEVSAVLERTGL